MRPGLVFVGGVLVLLGVATIATFTLLPSVSHNTTEFVTLPQSFAAHGSGLALLSGDDSDAGTLSVSWRSSAPVNVSLYPAAGCRVAALACATGPATTSWSAVSAGNWSTSGRLAFPYLLVWTGAGPSGGNLTASGTETRDVPVTPPLLTTLLIDGAGGVLAVIGGIAVFLGLFLRGGVYERRAPLVSRDADDVEAIARENRDSEPAPRPGH